MELEAQLQAIGRAELTPLVRRSLGNEAVAVETWAWTPIHGGTGAVLGGSVVYRCAGLATDRQGPRPWSIILKALQDPTTGGGTAYAKPPAGWDREVQAYRSGLLDALPAGLAAPRCFAVEARPGFVWLWLEDLGAAARPPWPVARFALAARHLGRLGGTALAPHPRPAHPWLQRGLLRYRAEQKRGFWADFERVRDTPALRRWWPGDLAPRVERLWGERQGWLDLLDRLPQALVHGDADRRNLFARGLPGGGEETVAIDWAFTGLAAVGEELVNLVVASALWLQVEVADLPALAEACLAGYAAGLADAGWRGDPRLAEAGFVVAAALRYGPLGPVQLALLDREGQDAWGRLVGEPYEAWVARCATVVRFAFDQLDAARGRIAAL